MAYQRSSKNQKLCDTAKEVLDKVAPLVDAEIDLQLLRASGVLRDDDLSATTTEFGHKGVAVKGFVGDQAIKGDAL